MTTGRFTLRVPTQIHEILRSTAKALGTDVNGLVNALIIDGLVGKVELTKKLETLAKQTENEQIDGERTLNGYP